MRHGEIEWVTFHVYSRPRQAPKTISAKIMSHSPHMYQLSIEKLCFAYFSPRSFLPWLKVSLSLAYETYFLAETINMNQEENYFKSQPHEINGCKK